MMAIKSQCDAQMAAAQASKSVEEVWAHAAMAEEDKKLAQKLSEIERDNG